MMRAILLRNGVWRASAASIAVRTIPSSRFCLSSSSTSSSTAASSAVGDVVREQFIFTDDPPLQAKAVENSLLQPGVVIYDGCCHLCHQGVKWVIKADKHRKIKFCCVQSKAAEPYLNLCDLNREDVLRRFLFIEGPGLYHQASTAALKVASHLPLPYSVFSSFLIIPTPLRDMVYDYVAKRRYDWFGKEEDCIVLQEIELLERFIDWEEMIGKNRPKH